MLLDTASQLFLEYGFAKVSIEQIARSAGVATRTIYTRFGGKKGLLKEMVVRDSGLTRARLEKISEMQADTEMCLRELALLFFEHALPSASHLMYCDLVAERDVELASQMDWMHNGPWRQGLETVLSHAIWRSACAPACAPSTLRDLFIGCITSTRYESVRATGFSGTAGKQALRLADEATQRFLTALT